MEYTQLVQLMENDIMRRTCALVFSILISTLISTNATADVLGTNNDDQIAGDLLPMLIPQFVIDQGKTGVGTAFPKSTLDVAGSLTLRTRTVSTGSFGTINVAEKDLVLFTSATDDYYVQLPPASADTVGRVYMIYDMSPSSYLQLQPDGTDTISGTSYGGGKVFYFMVIGNSPTSWASVAVGV